MTAFLKPKSSTVQDSGDQARHTQTEEEECCYYLETPLKSKEVFALTLGKVYNSTQTANTRIVNLTSSVPTELMVS